VRTTEGARRERKEGIKNEAKKGREALNKHFSGIPALI
jgi:hypothetical protein